MIQLGFSLASGFRRVGLGRKAFRPLDTTEVRARTTHARRHTHTLDWGGTLVHLEAGFASTLIDYYRSSLPAQVAHVIKLAEDPRNMLMVLSGQDRKRVERAFGGIGDASFCAEHGDQVQAGVAPRDQARRAHRVAAADRGLRPLVDPELTLAILEAYTMRTNGSNVQQKGSSLVWNYSEVDREFGSMQAKELHHHLSTVLESYPVNCGGYLEVRPRGINKGVMVDHSSPPVLHLRRRRLRALHRRRLGRRVHVLGAPRALLGERAPPRRLRPCLFTTVVGQKPSAAQYFLNDPDEVIELCQSLRLHSTRSNRNRSMNDLQSRGGMQDFGVSPSTSRHPRSNPFPALPGGTSFERALARGSAASGPRGRAGSGEAKLIEIRKSRYLKAPRIAGRPLCSTRRRTARRASPAPRRSPATSAARRASSRSTRQSRRPASPPCRPGTARSRGRRALAQVQRRRRRGIRRRRRRERELPRALERTCGQRRGRLGCGRAAPAASSASTGSSASLSTLRRLSSFHGYTSIEKSARHDSCVVGRCARRAAADVVARVPGAVRVPWRALHEAIFGSIPYWLARGEPHGGARCAFISGAHAHGARVRRVVVCRRAPCPLGTRRPRGGARRAAQARA